MTTKFVQIEADELNKIGRARGLGSRVMYMYVLHERSSEVYSKRLKVPCTGRF